MLYSCVIWVEILLEIQMPKFLCWKGEGGLVKKTGF